MGFALKHFLNNLNVALVSGADSYPTEPPFHPAEAYPEYPHAMSATDPVNRVYAMVRESLRLLGLDAANYGLANWNPLGELILPGHRVLIKPNFVLHFNAGKGPLECVVTHPSVIRAVCDYVMIALGSEGEITIGDAPQMNCDLDGLFRAAGMDRLREVLEVEGARRGLSIKIVDFRQERTFYKHGIVWERRSLRNGGAEPVLVGVGGDSFMEPIDSTRLYGADYYRRKTVQAHKGHRHEYVIAPEVLSSDVVISVPKLKVHRKVGTTLNLKNMVGISTDKNHLAHYRIGSADNGGDEMLDPGWDDRAERVLSDLFLGNNWRLGKYPFLTWKAFRKVWRRFQKNQSPAFTYGNWHGNDTAWRMVLDLNRILLFADAAGNPQVEPARRYFSVIDGVIGGEGEGPLHPDPYPSGAILAGFNPVAVDWVATRLMGFDPASIPLYRNAVEQMRGWLEGFDPGAFRVRSNVPSWESILESQAVIHSFRAPAGWRGTMEVNSPATAAPDVREASVSMISQ